MLGVICFTSDICLEWLCDYISLDAGTFSECFINLGGGEGRRGLRNSSTECVNLTRHQLIKL